MGSPHSVKFMVLAASDGTPLAGLTPTFTVYKNDQGTNVSQPSISGIGGGMYSFVPVFADPDRSISGIIDCGATAAQRYVFTGDLRPEMWDADDLASPTKTQADSIKTDTGDLVVRLGTPSTSTVAAHVETIESNLGTPSTSTVASHVETVETRLGTPTTSTVASHVEAIQTTIGTPANVTVSADILNIQDGVTGIKAKTDELPADPASQSAILTRLGTPVGASVSADIASISTIIDNIKKFQQGKWKIFDSGGDANRLVVYAPDGVTPLIKFALKDSTGSPTTTNPFAREPLP